MNMNDKIKSMVGYLVDFFGWLDSHHAASVAGDIQVKWSAYWTSHGLPDGWHDDGNESRTRNFVLGHYEHLRQIYRTGDEAAFEAAALRCILEEPAITYTAIVGDFGPGGGGAVGNNGAASTSEDEDSADEYKGGPGIPAAGAEHLRRRFERVE